MNINIEKLNEYLKSEEILEFNSDEECMEYFYTYDYQDLKSVEEMKSLQGKYGFNIGKKRYHINTENALDVLEDSNFSNEELNIMSDGILSLIENIENLILKYVTCNETRFSTEMGGNKCLMQLIGKN